MSRDLKYLYRVLLGGGKVKKIEITGNLYVITTVRTVWSESGNTGEVSSSDWQEVHTLRPQNG